MKKKSAGRKKLSNEDFVNRAQAVHKDNYNYSKTKYTKMSENVTVLCNQCHECFEVNAQSHLRGQGCSKCKVVEVGRPKGAIDAQEVFLGKAKKVHGDKFDYTDTVYTGITNKITVRCKECNTTFNQTAHSHLKGFGCLTCSHKNNGEKKRNNTERFKEKAEKIHGKTAFNYSKVKCEKGSDRVIIICNGCHQEFERTASLHLKAGKHGCPLCVRKSA